METKERNDSANSAMARKSEISDRFDFLALITDVKIPVIVKEIRDHIMTDNALNEMRDLTVDEIREHGMDNLVDVSITKFSDTAKYDKVSYKGVEIQISDLLALNSFDLSDIWDEIWDERPISGGWIREAVYTFTDKVDSHTEADIIDAHPYRYNMIYKISNDCNGKNQYPIGYLMEYNCHLYDIMTEGAAYTSNLCDNYRDGLRVGKTAEHGGNDEENDIKCQMFHEFLIRYMSGEFKYRKSTRSKFKYYHELPYQAQRNIKRVVGTLNEIFDID